MLSGSAITAWKDGGSLWKAWNSRLVIVSLKVLCRRRVSMLHVFSCYAPTHAAIREEKDTVGRINFEDKKFRGFRGYLLNLEIKYPRNFLHNRSGRFLFNMCTWWVNC